MEEIIPRIPRELLLSELTPEKKLRTTNKSGNEIYIVTWQDSPNVVRELGRLREIAFRAAGGIAVSAVTARHGKNYEDGQQKRQEFFHIHLDAHSFRTNKAAAAISPPCHCSLRCFGRQYTPPF